MYDDSFRTSQQTHSVSMTRPTGYCCLGNQSLFILRTIWNTQIQKVKVMLRTTVSRPVCQVSSTHLGLTTRFLLLSDSCGFVDGGRSLWRKNRSAVYICCWSLPAQSFLGPSPAGLVTIFYCLILETLPTWRTTSPYLYPPGTGWTSYTPRHWVLFSSLPTTRRATVEVFEPATTCGPSQTDTLCGQNI
jgi:hypothetical protein